MQPEISTYGSPFPSNAFSDNRSTQSRDLEFQIDCVLPDSEAGMVTHVAWSPWFDLRLTKSSNTASLASVLAASRLDGSIHLCLVNRTSGVQHLTCNSTRELLSPQRIAVTRLAWTRRNGELTLGISRNGIFSVSAHSTRAADPLMSKFVNCRHDNFSPAAGSTASDS